jgi:hypothetical protein
MQRFKYSLAIALCASLCAALPAYGQGNVLGLPAVPQIAPAAKPAASAADKAAQPAASAATPQQLDDQAKSVLSGGVTLASNYDGRTVTVVVTTNNTYTSQEQRKAALKAARLVQRDVKVSCAKQCKAAASMPAPKILPGGKLEFAMVVNDYPRALSNEDMVALLLGRPLAVIAQAAPQPAASGALAPAASAPATAPASPPASAPVGITTPAVSPAPAVRAVQ